MPTESLTDYEEPETLTEAELCGDELGEEPEQNTLSKVLIPAFARLIKVILDNENPNERLQCSIRAEKLLSLIETNKSYNLGQIEAYVLRLKPEDESTPSAVGTEILHDLELLINRITAATIIQAKEALEPVLTVDEVAQRWNVSAKTISRWRNRGLVARSFMFDGRQRVGFLESSLNRFAATYPRLVQRGRRFSRMTEGEPIKITERANQLLKEGVSKTLLIKQLSEETGRSIETIRVLLHKQETFNGAKSGITTREMNQRRVERVVELPLEYMTSPDFKKRGADKKILAPTPPSQSGVRMPRRPTDLPEYIASLYDVPLLTAEQETHLFRKYNYLKYKASERRDELNRARPKAQLLDEIESLYREATETRKLLTRSNLRLVVAVAKKYIGITGDLFDKVSEGNLSLMRAVEKFDYTRGFKFSTYASWAIKKNYIRAYSNEIKQTARFRTGHEEELDARIDDGTNPTIELAAQSQRENQVKIILNELTDRERQIIASRFGIGPEREPMTLKDIGVELGVTKERVRQIEARALQKLRWACGEEPNSEFMK